MTDFGWSYSPGVTSLPWDHDDSAWIDDLIEQVDLGEGGTP